jgi:pyruvate-formate lyase
MRNEMIGAVVRRAIEHPEFRRRLMDSPQDALQSHGFALEQDDLAEIEKIRTSLGDAGEDVEQRLVNIAEQYGVHPRPGA